MGISEPHHYTCIEAKQNPDYEQSKGFLDKISPLRPRKFHFENLGRKCRDYILSSDFVVIQIDRLSISCIPLYSLGLAVASALISAYIRSIAFLKAFAVCGLLSLSLLRAD